MRKKCIISFVLLSVILFLVQKERGYGEIFIPSTDTPLVDLSNFSKEKLREFRTLCEEKGGEFILYAPKGFEMAIRVKANGDVIAMKKEVNSVIRIVFKKSVYFYPSSRNGNNPIFSLDGKNWCRVSELFGGSMSFSAGDEKIDGYSFLVYDLDFIIEEKK